MALKWLLLKLTMADISAKIRQGARPPATAPTRGGQHGNRYRRLIYLIIMLSLYLCVVSAWCLCLCDRLACYSVYYVSTQAVGPVCRTAWRAASS